MGEFLEGYIWKGERAKRKYKESRTRRGMILAIKEKWKAERIRWNESKKER